MQFQLLPQFMASRRTLNPGKRIFNFQFSIFNDKETGFTLIEILIAVVILVIIAILGLIISFDFYKNFSIRSERNNIVSILQKARSQSLSNISQTRHGVHFSSSPLQYIIFECDPSAPQCSDYIDADTSKDIVIDPGYGISITNPTPSFDVVFDQLSGSCIASPTFNCDSDNPITVSGGVNPYDINVNSEGRIDW